MKNTRDHAEVPEIRRRLGLDGARPPLRKTFTSGIRRSSSQLKRNLSERRRSWAGGSSSAVSRSRDRVDKSSPEGSMMEKVKEEEEKKEDARTHDHGAAVAPVVDAPVAVA